MVVGTIGYFLSFFQRDSAVVGSVGRQFSEEFLPKDF
jgi:hypothetical protein